MNLLWGWAHCAHPHPCCCVPLALLSLTHLLSLCCCVLELVLASWGEKCTLLVHFSYLSWGTGQDWLEEGVSN